MRRRTFAAAAVLLIACLGACALPTAQRQTLDTISAREPVLFEQRARFGYLPDETRGIRPDVVVWQQYGTLTLTPTALYFLAGSESATISYAAITDVEVTAVDHWPHPPFGQPRPLDNILVVRTIDDVFRFAGRTDDCDRGCVFQLRESAHAKSPFQARDVIAAHRGAVDAFGRIDSQAVVAMVTRFRPRQLSGGPRGAVPAAIADRFAEWTRDGVEGLASIEPIVFTDWSWDGRWLDPAPAEFLSRTRADLTRLIVVDLLSISFSPATTGSREAVTATYRILVDFYDLQPAKPGTHFSYEHTVSREQQDWQDNSAARMESDLRAALRVVGGRIDALTALAR